MEKLDIGTVDTQVISVGADAKGYKNPNDVDFEVKYSEDYKGDKHMPEGVITISKESAKQFADLGIGRIVEAKAETSASNDSETQTTEEEKTSKRGKK